MSETLNHRPRAAVHWNINAIPNGIVSTNKQTHKQTLLQTTYTTTLSLGSVNDCLCERNNLRNTTA